MRSAFALTSHLEVSRAMVMAMARKGRRRRRRRRRARRRRREARKASRRTSKGDVGAQGGSCRLAGRSLDT